MGLIIKRLTALLIAISCLPFSSAVFAEDAALEEIIVTARKQNEGLQDVPVTIAALTEADLDRYNITSLVDAAKMVPNMVVAAGGSGNGSSLRLRGIGSSSISAAFDHSVAINLDGVVVNRGRFIHNSYMDMGQLEVLKGPQSLYFGKSATAGVVSITTNDPGDEFEFQASAGLESEYEGTFTEVVVSGPLTETLGARLAVGWTENEELFENYSFANDPVNVPISGTEKYFGDESLNARLTLVWNPTDTFQAKLKYNYSEYDNDGGGTAWTEEVCPDGVHQPTGVPSGAAVFTSFQGVDDCKINGNTSKVNLNPGLRDGLPQGYDNGKPGLEQETNFLSLKLDWDINENLTASSITGWVDLRHWELDDYSYGASVFGGLHNNTYQSISQEFQLTSDFDGPVNFQAGLFYQEINQEFDAYQYAFNLPIIPRFFGDLLAGGSYGDYVDNVAAASGRTILYPVDPAGATVGPDPFTGNEYDYRKDHFLDTDAYSAFFALYWDINDRTELTIGARYTDEEKEGYIKIPYLHAGAALFGFGAPPLIEGLEFEDDNISPEIALNYHVTDYASVFVAYKEGFKSGGIDNSALPTAALNPLDPSFNGFGFLVYESEEAEGFELGVKADLLDGAMRLNASAFSFEYTDLQVQLFDSTIIQFSTFNASALETEGLEFDMLWSTNIEGLDVRSAWAWTNTEYTDDFFTATGENLKGEDGVGSADITGFIGATYDFALGGSGWRASLSADARYTGDYAWTASLDPLEQDSFWVVDAAFSVYSEDGRHQINLIGRNINDEIYIIGGGAIPGRIPANNTGANTLDQAATTPLGRTISLQYRFTL
ncbi:MAG: TonB-dependent receptor [Pseudomonadales bacterium]